MGRSGVERPWGALEALASAPCLALLLYGLELRSGFDELLGLSRIELQGDEPWLLPAVRLDALGYPLPIVHQNEARDRMRAVRRS